MSESIKFGPEWLRNSVANVSAAQSNDQLAVGATLNSPTNISGGGGGLAGNSSSLLNATRPQLAENRYGREEMLSLCDKSPKKPEFLAKYKKLYVDTVQLPLALTPQTDDEVRLWQIRNPVSVGLSSRGGAGRGSSIERGRGRARTSFHSGPTYQRSTSLFDEDPRTNGSVSAQSFWDFSLVTNFLSRFRSSGRGWIATDSGRPQPTGPRPVRAKCARPTRKTIGASPRKRRRRWWTGAIRSVARAAAERHGKSGVSMGNGEALEPGEIWERLERLLSLNFWSFSLSQELRFVEICVNLSILVKFMKI